LKNRRRIDLILFHKECLANIVRHSQATRVDTLVCATKKAITVSITDNGQGSLTEVPASLARRAKLMRAQASIDHLSKDGTAITLTLKLRRLGTLR
jgi:signal transduction histidine kinase